jgi:addiction module HigA family antidote
MLPLKLTAGALAKQMGLKDRTRVERIAREKQPITADTALRLARVFGTSPQMWINLQTNHDLSVAALAAKDELAAIQPLAVA